MLNEGGWGRRRPTDIFFLIIAGAKLLHLFQIQQNPLFSKFIATEHQAHNPGLDCSVLLVVSIVLVLLQLSTKYLFHRVNSS